MSKIITALEFINKKLWPRGEWDDEFDFYLYKPDIDDNTYYQINRNEYMGHLRGYIFLPKDHKLYGMDYRDKNFPDLYVHGGITCSDEWLDGSDLWRLGFDCAHNGDLSPFRKENYVDNDRYRNVDYVLREIQNLHNQILTV